MVFEASVFVAVVAERVACMEPGSGCAGWGCNKDWKMRRLTGNKHFSYSTGY